MLMQQYPEQQDATLCNNVVTYVTTYVTMECYSNDAMVTRYITISCYSQQKTTEKEIFENIFFAKELSSHIHNQVKTDRNLTKIWVWYVSPFISSEIQMINNI